MIHDFENAGDSPIRFVTVELLDPADPGDNPRTPG